jgi:hypothetical protein
VHLLACSSVHGQQNKKSGTVDSEAEELAPELKQST